jgi:CheY-like chemotaxis protein
LHESLRAAVLSMAYSADEKGLQLLCDIDPGVPRMVNADPARLRQILVNLLGNAIKFTSHGEVALIAGYEAADGAAPVFHLVVRDTGIGIPQDQLPLIFDAFSQADSSTTRKFGGTGLGLAICNRLAKLMGGEIWAESEINRGSEFHFTAGFGLAATDGNGPNEHKKETSVSAELAGWKVLLAEDNPANRMVARLTLEQAGFLVKEVENGREALEALRTGRFDLVLMDCRMPVMDGYAATRYIRQLKGRGSQVPIIALTASVCKEDRQRAEEAGMDDFVSKPFQTRELVSKCLAWANVNRDLGALANSVDSGSKVGGGKISPDSSNYSPEFLNSLMTIFLETARPVFESLLKAVENREWSQAQYSAHWLQGGAARILDPLLQERLVQLERTLGTESPAISKADMDALTGLFLSACKSAEQRLSQRGAQCAIA